MKLKTALVALSCLTCVTSFAKDDSSINVNSLQFKKVIDIDQYKGMTYLNFMHTQVYPALEGIDPSSLPKDPKTHFVDFQAALQASDGVQVKIDSENTTFHVAYNSKSGETSGRSFGHSEAVKLSDPSDKVYLVGDHKNKPETPGLGDIVTKDSDSQLHLFYSNLVKIIANCDTSTFSSSPASEEDQAVGTNFVAIYTAEQDRHLMAPLSEAGWMQHQPWDDALFQVTMLGAFHGGQETMTLMYDGKFTSQVQDQESHETRQANMSDYWQKSKSGSNRSGINETRSQFLAMGAAITAYEAAKNVAEYKTVKDDLGSEGKNIIAEIAEYFVNNKASTNMSAKADRLATDIAALMVQIHNDAKDITEYIASKKAASDTGSDDDSGNKKGKGGTHKRKPESN